LGNLYIGLREQKDLLHTIHIPEGNFELLCQSQYEIRFKVSPTNHQLEQHEEDYGMFSLSSSKTCLIKVGVDELDSEPVIETQISKPRAYAYV